MIIISAPASLIEYKTSSKEDCLSNSPALAADGKEAKKQSYGLIKNKFRELKSGAISWSEITREDKQFVEAEKRCIYCGAESNLHWEHIVPKSLRIRQECEICDTIQGIHNQIWACGICNSAKGTKGLYEFYRGKYPGEKKFYDLIPPLLEKKYLSGYGSVPKPRRENDYKLS